MTRKERVDSILTRAGKDFNWGFGRFEHWDTADCVEHTPSGTKFFFGNMVYVNKSAHYDAPFKKHDGEYDMSAKDWVEKINQFQTWIAMKQAASLLGRLGGSVKSEKKTLAVRENGKKGGRPGMYTVTLNDADTGTDESWPGLTKRQAISLAKETAAFNPTCAVFIEWFRKSDGQRGYLNPSGDHEITGHAW